MRFGVPMCGALAALFLSLPGTSSRPARDVALRPAPTSSGFSVGTAALQPAVSEGLAAINAPEWHNAGFNGQGVKVVVIDSSFKDLSSVANVQFRDFVPNAGCDFSSAHGTAVAQIVREVAPAAEIAAYCVRDRNDLFYAADVATAPSEHVQVIVQSLSWFNSSAGNGTLAPPGTPEALAAQARARGILWINSVGNFAQRHWSGTFADADGDTWHNFTPTDEGNSFSLPSGAEICAYLKWNEWPGSANNFNFSLWRQLLPGGSTEEQLETGSSGYPAGHLFGSANPQNGGDPPIEQFCYRNESPDEMQTFLAIQRVASTGTSRFDLFINRFALQYTEAAGSVVEPATSPDAMAVGAACWQGTQAEPYSSRGPTIDGRTKPDLVGPDSVTSPYAEFGPFAGCGVSGFRGSSAAAPHVAGAAALVFQRFPGSGPVQVQAYLESNARDLAPAGKDNASGAGMLRLPALTPPPPPPSPPPPPPPRLRVVDFRTSPKRLRPGSHLRAQAMITVDDAVLSGGGQVLCSATVGSRALRARSARFRNRFAECVWTVPRAAKGKVLRGSVGASYRGATIRKSFRLRVRSA